MIYYTSKADVALGKFAKSYYPVIVPSTLSVMLTGAEFIKILYFAGYQPVLIWRGGDCVSFDGPEVSQRPKRTRMRGMTI